MEPISLSLAGSYLAESVFSPRAIMSEIIVKALRILVLMSSGFLESYVEGKTARLL